MNSSKSRQSLCAYGRRCCKRTSAKRALWRLWNKAKPDFKEALVATNPAPNPNERLLKVFDTEQEAEAMVVKGLLESEGIDCEIRGIDLPQDVMPLGGTIVLVRGEEAPSALQIIEE